MRETVASQSSHDDARYGSNLVDVHVRTLIPIACSLPRSRVGLKLFDFFRQEFLQKDASKPFPYGHTH
jgi:hypothetical protein